MAFVLLLLVALAMGFVRGPTSAGAMDGVARAAEPVNEAERCARDAGAPAADPPVPSVGQPAADGSQASATIVVVIPPTVAVRVERTELVEAQTNTGCRPRPDDRWLIFEGNGTRAATPDDVRAVMALTRLGDWRQPGEWHRLSR
jgi:hypothetical protein